MTDILPQPSLAVWLKGNALAMLVLALSILTGTAGAIWTVSKWVASYESRATSAQSDLLTATRDVAALQGNIVSLDRRVNELRAQVLELHNLSEHEALTLKARLDTIDALARFSAERTFQPPLPQPGQRR